MNSFISKFKLATALCIAAISVTSCLKEENDPTAYFSGFFTITGSTPNYKLIDDKGNVVYPSIESVNSITNQKGFGDNKRAYLNGTYNHENGYSKNADGSLTIKNATLNSGQYVFTTPCKTKDEVEKENILSIDSIFPIQTLKQVWMANGYFNTIINGQYSATDEGKGIAPTINLMVVPTSIAENSVKFTLLYNRHSSKNVSAAGSADFVNSFDVSKLDIPGNDSIQIVLSVQGADPWTMKFARKCFQGIK